MISPEDINVDGMEREMSIASRRAYMKRCDMETKKAIKNEVRKMKRKIEVDICLNASEIAEELWNWDDVEQAEFLWQLALLYKHNKINFLSQLHFVSSEITNTPFIYNKELIVSMLEDVLQCIKGEGEAK